MSLDRNLLTVRRYLLHPETSLGSWGEIVERLTEGLATHGFEIEAPWHSSVHTRHGWVRPDDPLSTDFESGPNGWRMMPMIWLSYRLDERRVQPALLRAKLKRACADWCSERGVERIPASVRKEIKDRITDELLAGTRPKMRTFGVAIDTDHGHLYIDTTSEKRCDEIKRLLFRSTNWRFEEETPYKWTEDGDRLMATVGAGEDLGARFLGWLWRHPDKQEDGVRVGSEDRQITWTVTDKVELISNNETRWAGRHVHSTEDVVAQRAIAEGYWPRSLNIELAIDEEHVFDFVLTAPSCQVSQLRDSTKPEHMGTEDDAEMACVATRLLNLRWLYETIHGLFGCYEADVLGRRAN